MLLCQIMDIRHLIVTHLCRLDSLAWLHCQVLCRLNLQSLQQWRATTYLIAAVPPHWPLGSFSHSPNISHSPSPNSTFPCHLLLGHSVWLLPPLAKSLIPQCPHTFMYTVIVYIFPWIFPTASLKHFMIISWIYICGFPHISLSLSPSRLKIRFKNRITVCTGWCVTNRTNCITVNTTLGLWLFLDISEKYADLASFTAFW